MTSHPARRLAAPIASPARLSTHWLASTADRAAPHMIASAAHRVATHSRASAADRVARAEPWQDTGGRAGSAAGDVAAKRQAGMPAQKYGPCLTAHLTTEAHP